MSEPLNQHDRDSRELRELCAQRDSARATVRQQSARIAELEAERDQHQATATALISLLADIRKACGDNGTRMQPELVEFIGAMSAERDRLREEVEQLKLAEEGAAEAFGVAVQDKRDLEAEVKRLQSLLDGAYASIRQYAARTTHKDQA